MFFKSCLINVFTVNIFVFIIRSEKKLIVILLFKKLIYEKQPALIHNVGVNYVDNRFGENENEAVETHNQDIGISRDQKATTLRLQDQKTVTSTFGD